MLRRYLVIALLGASLVAFADTARADDFQDGVRAYAAGDLKTALTHWQQAAEDNHAGAAYLLASLYASGATGSPQHHLAFRYYLQAAEAGHTEAQVALSRYFRHGNAAAGIEVNLEQAHSWLSIAADSRNSHAQYILGDMHFKGEGVVQNSHRGMRWFLLAADKKYPRALARLAHIYAQGEIVAADPARAFMYMSLAAEEASGLERPAIVRQYDQMLASVLPQDRQRGLQMAAEWRAERQALYQ